jgi:hypothetical protein
VKVPIDPAELLSGDILIWAEGDDYTCATGTLKDHIRKLCDEYVGRLILIEDETGLMAQWKPGRYDVRRHVCECKCRRT